MTVRSRSRPRISMRGLAKYVVAGPSRGKRILQDFKYPDPAGFAQAKYYDPARTAIRRFHRRHQSVENLQQKATQLGQEASLATGQRAVELEQNARVLRQYADHFGDLRIDLEASPRWKVKVGKVQVGCMPDLYGRVRGRVWALRLDFSARAEKDKKLYKVLAQLMYMGAVSAGVNLPPSAFKVLCVSDGARYQAVSGRSRIAQDIEAACEMIEALWPRI